LNAALRRIFSSLQIHNYRLFFTGQLVSVTGNWMQRVAQAWLVLELTGSGTAIGGVLALQYLPLLLLAPYGGVLADRFDKRRLLYLTQVSAAAIAGLLGMLVISERIELWMVYALAGLLGLVTAFDNPARNAFVMEIVGRDHIKNAVSLHSTLVNVARIFGPALAGALIITIGIGPCFVINGLSFFGLVVALLLMRRAELHTTQPQGRRPGQLREGFRYVRSSPEVLTLLLMMAAIGVFAWEFQVSLPLMARFTFDGDAATFGSMMAAMAGGAVVGGLRTASRGTQPVMAIPRTAALFGLVQLAAAAAPNLALAYGALAVLGYTGVSFLALGNATVQLLAAAEMRARVLSLWTVAFLGSTPIGGPIVGWIGEHIGPRYGLGIGGVASILAAVAGHRGLAMVNRQTMVEPSHEAGQGRPITDLR
jgi:MFS family permease